MRKTAIASGLLLLLDDVALLTKIAARKTAGVLGDDLALNAEQVSGVKPERELPVVWAVAKGSLRNKAILVPAALLVSAVAPWAVIPLLMLGGLYLCYEGVEKVLHAWSHRAQTPAGGDLAALDPAIPADQVAVWEQEKIRGAVRTDFILSAEIIVITLGTLGAVPFGLRVAVLVSIALLMTAGVYGLVACIEGDKEVAAPSVRRGFNPGGPQGLKTCHFHRFGRGAGA